MQPQAAEGQCLTGMNGSACGHACSVSAADAGFCVGPCARSQSLRAWGLVFVCSVWPKSVIRAQSDLGLMPDIGLEALPLCSLFLLCPEGPVAVSPGWQGGVPGGAIPLPVWRRTSASGQVHLCLCGGTPLPAWGVAGCSGRQTVRCCLSVLFYVPVVETGLLSGFAGR